MRDLITAALNNIDWQLAKLAVELTGSRAEALRLIDAVHRRAEHPMARVLLAEGAAMFKARRHLAAALYGGTPAEPLEPRRTTTEPRNLHQAPHRAPVARKPAEQRRRLSA